MKGGLGISASTKASVQTQPPSSGRFAIYGLTGILDGAPSENRPSALGLGRCYELTVAAKGLAFLDLDAENAHRTHKNVSSFRS